MRYSHFIVSVSAAVDSDQCAAEYQASSSHQNKVKSVHLCVGNTAAHQLRKMRHQRKVLSGFDRRIKCWKYSACNKHLNSYWLVHIGIRSHWCAASAQQSTSSGNVPWSLLLPLTGRTDLNPVQATQLHAGPHTPTSSKPQLSLRERDSEATTAEGCQRERLVWGVCGVRSHASAHHLSAVFLPSLVKCLL